MTVTKVPSIPTSPVCGSVAVHSTSVTPILKVEPDAGTHVTGTSVLVAFLAWASGIGDHRAGGAGGVDSLRGAGDPSGRRDPARRS